MREQLYGVRAGRGSGKQAEGSDWRAPFSAFLHLPLPLPASAPRRPFSPFPFPPSPFSFPRLQPRSTCTHSTSRSSRSTSSSRSASASGSHAGSAPPATISSAPAIFPPSPFCSRSSPPRPPRSPSSPCPASAHAGQSHLPPAHLRLSVGRIGVAVWLLPGYFRGEQETAYARLESRFGVGTRRLTSVIFLVSRFLGDAVRVFASAIPLALVTGWSVPWAIVGDGRGDDDLYLVRRLQGGRLDRRHAAHRLPRGRRGDALHRLEARRRRGNAFIAAAMAGKLG